MSPQYLVISSWCLRWSFLGSSCVFYSIWEMVTLNQVNSPTWSLIVVLSDTQNTVYIICFGCFSDFLFFLQHCNHSDHRALSCVYNAYLALPDSSTERDLQKVLQQLEPQISFLEELTKMGGAMRTVLTKILTNQQTFKDLSMGKYWSRVTIYNLHVFGNAGIRIHCCCR